MTPTELRSIEVEVRLVDGPGGGKAVRGYGLVYNKPSQVLYTAKGEPFRETIRRGAATRALADGDLQVNAHHDARQLLGRRSSGTARFGEDSTGLWYEADLPDTSYARDLAASLARGDIRGSSFVFSTMDDSWGPADAQGVMSRELRAIHVFDMGPVVNPAYLDTTAAMRSLDGHLAAAAEPAPAVVTYPTPDQIDLLNRLRLVRLG